MLSATLDHPLITYAMPPSALQTPQAAEEWARSLPPQAQRLLADKMRAVVLGMPPGARLALGRYLASQGVPVPPEVSEGYLGEAAAGGSSAAGYGALAGAIAGIAGALYTSHQDAKSQSSMFGASLANDQAIAQIQGSSFVQSNQALADATKLAAAIAGQTAIAKSEVHSSTLVAVMPWVAGIVGLGVVGWGIMAYMKRKKK